VLQFSDEVLDGTGECILHSVLQARKSINFRLIDEQARDRDIEWKTLSVYSLLMCGVDCNVRNNEGETALMYVLGKGMVLVAQHITLYVSAPTMVEGSNPVGAQVEALSHGQSRQHDHALCDHSWTTNEKKLPSVLHSQVTVAVVFYFCFPEYATTTKSTSNRHWPPARQRSTRRGSSSSSTRRTMPANRPLVNSFGEKKSIYKLSHK